MQFCCSRLLLGGKKSIKATMQCCNAHIVQLVLTSDELLAVDACTSHSSAAVPIEYACAFGTGSIGKSPCASSRPYGTPLIVKICSNSSSSSSCDVRSIRVLRVPYYTSYC
eukprot:2129-Heterococcus_DN1.PRE.2